MQWLWGISVKQSRGKGSWASQGKTFGQKSQNIWKKWMGYCISPLSLSKAKRRCVGFCHDCIESWQAEHLTELVVLAAGAGKGTGSAATFSLLWKVFLGLMVDTEGFVIAFGCYYEKLIWFTLIEGKSFSITGGYNRFVPPCF